MYGGIFGIGKFYESGESRIITKYYHKMKHLYKPRFFNRLYHCYYHSNETHGSIPSGSCRYNSLSKVEFTVVISDDHSRVVLEGTPGSDYINANYVSVCKVFYFKWRFIKCPTFSRS